MLPNANDLHSFLEIVRTKNLSRAAERVGLSQPALSQAIKRLEHNFGAQLLIRSKGGVTPTKSGEKLAIRAKNLLDEWEKLKDETLRDELEVRGRYSIGIHTSLALYSVEHFMPQLLGQYPSLEIRLHHDLSRKITEDVISFKLDFGIVVNPVPHPDLVIKELFKDEVTFWRSKKKVNTNSIENENCVLIVEPALAQTQELLRKLAKQKIIIRRILTSSSLDVIARLAASGAGVGVLPTRVAKNGGNNLLKVGPQLPLFNDKICLIFRQDGQKSPAARILKDFITKALRKL
jgi:DNA-binding transcriptional LysR family regulator